MLRTISGEPVRAFAMKLPVSLSKFSFCSVMEAFKPPVAGKDGTREEVMVKYLVGLHANPELLEKLPELKGKVAGCWRAPEACHVGTLSGLANRQAVCSNFAPLAI